MSPTTERDAVEHVYREEFLRIVAGLMRLVRDFDVADDAVQDAFASALAHWPIDGVPRNPAAWIATTARNRALDRMRRRRAAKSVSLREAGAAESADDALARLEADERDGASDEAAIGDERLSLIFTCCHPALGFESQVTLTLRMVAGLTVVEIARAFLVPEATIAQRLTRAKAKIREAGIPFRAPAPGQVSERLRAVSSVLYLIFNEGYSASCGDGLLRADLCAEAIRLARIVATRLDKQPEALGLLALFLLQHSRCAARRAMNGDFVPLDRHDRTLWDAGAIREGLLALERAGRPDPPGPYLLQARIAAVHARADRAEATDWVELVRHYDALSVLYPSPVVEINRAVAIARSEGPQRGLQILQRRDIESACANYHYLYAARAELLRKLARFGEAGAEYDRAVGLAKNAAERRWLRARRDEIRPVDGV